MGDFSSEDMELSTSELSIYDKLSETIDLVRQTGYQCGMSDKAIEKFIKQLLEKNEPQRGPPRFPLLMVLYKGLVTLGIVLLTAYFMIQPYTLSPSESTLTRIHPWGSLFHHIRLLPLPITKKYMLEKCPEWWGLDCRRNMSLTAKCSCCCSMKTLVAPVDERQLSDIRQLQGQPLLIKTGQYRSYAEMKHFQSLYPELTNFVIQEEAAELWSGPSKQQPPFPVFWQTPQNKSQILQEIFPIFSSLLFPKDISLKSCFLIHHPRLQDMTYRLQNTFVVGSGQLNLHVLPSLFCREHCKALMVELEAGDIGFTNVDYWTTSFNSRGSEPVVVCDGSAS
ncbi:bombesin receptor-activated protein C6orf89 homolog isoform X2 [Erythrolamprus reginae]|uniref:bombesin receptor-activated protein C6orf89 homolog isoform X2 n=1 Tax=Erythrolamprus reginae TaxID=121349 RepID=UPI00396CB88B